LQLPLLLKLSGYDRCFLRISQLGLLLCCDLNFAHIHIKVFQESKLLLLDHVSDFLYGRLHLLIELKLKQVCLISLWFWLNARLWAEIRFRNVSHVFLSILWTWPILAWRQQLRRHGLWHLL